MIVYFGTTTAVELGDSVEFKSALFWRGWRPGRVTYLPGVSKPHPQIEDGDGLLWLGVAGQDGTFRGIYIDHETSTVSKSVRFVDRSTPDGWVTPEDIGPEDW